MAEFARRFLRYPDLFPSRIGGEAWGAGRLRLDFAGGPQVIEGLADWQIEVIEAAWGPLAGPAGESEPARFRLLRAAQRDFRQIDLCAWPNSFDFDHQPERVRFAGRHALAVLELPGGRLERGALWSAAGDGAEFAGVFENFFRVALAYRLLDLGGVLLHSAAVVDGGRAYVFVGRSGAGKSTLSRLSLDGGREVLSDDLNAVALESSGQEGDRVIGGRLPFAGVLRSPVSARRSVPLGGLLSLEQAPPGAAHDVEEVSRARGVASLLAAAPFVNADPLRAERLERVLLEICGGGPGDGSVALARLRFHRRDDRFWDELRRFFASRHRSGPVAGADPSA